MENDNTMDQKKSNLGFKKPDQKETNPVHEVKQLTKVYKKRFWILFLYSICSMLNNVQFNKYSSVSNIYLCFYNVSSAAINWTAQIFMVICIIFPFPASWFFDRFGLKIVVIVGSALTCISTVMQCAPIYEDRFSVIMISQTVAAIGMVLLFPVPSRLANAWFGPNEISRATAIAAISLQFGCAVSFIISPMFVPYTCSEIENIRWGHSIETYILTACNIVIFLLILLSFESKPEIPPNMAEAEKSNDISNKKLILTLMKNINFHLLLIAYGLVIGTFYSITVILNEMLIPLYPGSEVTIGWMGFLMYLTGTIGSIIFGQILDVTHQFKKVSLAIAWFTFLSMCAFTGFLLIPAMWIPMVTISILGFFIMSFIPASFELVCEITYPCPESATSGLLNASSMLISVIQIIAAPIILKAYDSLACNIFFCAILLLASVITSFIKCDCKRTIRNQKEEAN